VQDLLLRWDESSPVNLFTRFREEDDCNIDSRSLGILTS